MYVFFRSTEAGRPGGVARAAGHGEAGPRPVQGEDGPV